MDTRKTNPEQLTAEEWDTIRRLRHQARAPRGGPPLAEVWREVHILIKNHMTSDCIADACIILNQQDTDSCTSPEAI